MFLRNVLLAVGGAAGLAGIALLVVWIRQPTTGQAPTAAVVVHEVLVAARPIAIGSLLRPEDFGWKSVAADVIPSGSYARGQINEAELVGAVARRDFHAGEPLAADALVKPDDRGFLGAVLRPGNRAITIAVDAPQSASGLLSPGDHVDIILTQSFGDMSPSSGRRAVGETVLSDIRVVAVDQTLSAAPKPISANRLSPTDARVPKTITLEMDERDAEKLLVAVQLGKIELIVRATRMPAQEAQAGEPVMASTWASDVSPALKTLGPIAVTPGKALAKADAKASPALGMVIMRGAKIEMR